MLRFTFFYSVESAQNLTTQLLWVYNNEQVNFSLGEIQPRQEER